MAWVVGIGLALLAASARADERQLAKEHYVKGSKYFSLGRFDEAVHEYEASFELIGDPRLLYNIAQAHRLNGNAPKALFFYRSYLSRVPGSPVIAEVQEKIAELQRLIDQQTKTQSQPPPKPTPPEASPSRPRAHEPETTPAPTAAPPAPAPSRSATADRRAPRAKIFAGGTLVAVGVAALATGVACNVLGLRAASELAADADAGRVFDPTKESRGRAYATAGLALDVAGGVVAVAGATLLALGARDAHRERRTTSVPRLAVTPGRIAAVWEARF
jgi:tetratricopeptide (TPR) repeat protein